MSNPETIDLDVAQRVLAAQPFSALLGARITSFGDGGAVLELPIVDQLRQQFGLVHGGVLAYSVDNALTFAAGTVLGPNIVTSGLTVHYLASARDGVLRASASVTAYDERRADVDVVVEEIAPGGGGRTCAIGKGSAVVRGSRP